MTETHSAAETYSVELSYEAKRPLSYLFPRIDHWRQRMQARPASPELGSSLLRDDQAVHPFLISLRLLCCPVCAYNPKMLPRLDEIETDLLARQTRAEPEGGPARSKASTS